MRKNDQNFQTFKFNVRDSFYRKEIYIHIYICQEQGQPTKRCSGLAAGYCTKGQELESQVRHGCPYCLFLAPPVAARFGAQNW